jgi:integrase/recombinase XerD
MDFYEFIGGQNSDETVRAYKIDLAQYKKFTGGVIDRPSVISFRDFLIQQGMSPSTIARKMSSLRSFCEYLRGTGQLTIDPFVGIKLPKASVKDPTQAFTDDEARKMLKLAAKDKRDFLILSLLFFAGLRRSEAANLKDGDISMSEGTMVLRIFGKGGKFRTLPCHPKLQQAILDFQTLPRPIGGTLLGVKDHSIFNLVKKYAKLAGVTRSVSPHSCRATAISQLLENGESPRNVADFAGHANIATTIGSYDKKRDGIKNSSALKLKF